MSRLLCIIGLAAMIAGCNTTSNEKTAISTTDTTNPYRIGYWTGTANTCQSMGREGPGYVMISKIRGKYEADLNFDKGFRLNGNVGNSADGLSGNWRCKKARNVVIAVYNKKTSNSLIKPVGDLKIGLAAYKKLYYGTALKHFRPLSEQGNAAAQHRLGWMHFGALGVPQDEAEGVRLILSAAEKDYIYAQSDLGELYINGRGVDQNFAEGIKWYRRAAENGYGRAQFRLGMYYYMGKYAPQDYNESLKWYRLAYNQGFPHARRKVEFLERYLKSKQVEESSN